MNSEDLNSEEKKLMTCDYNYTGPSMNPTLKIGDGLTVIPYGDSSIRIGDVVVFHSPERERYIVHRVISVNSRGIRTKGDNNSRADSWILRPEDIVGRVISAQRKSKSITIYGGTRGRLLAPVLWTIKRINVTVSSIFRPIYHYLARTGIARKLLSRLIKTQILYFKRPDGTEMQLIMGRRVIGRYFPGKDQWLIKRPFRLFVDEKSLPQRDQGDQKHPANRE